MKATKATLNRERLSYSTLNSEICEIDLYNLDNNNLLLSEKAGLKRPMNMNNFLFLFFGGGGAAPMAYGGSQARGQIRAVVASLHHSHSNLGSELHLQSIP